MVKKSIEERVARIDEKVLEMHKMLMGNGQPGMFQEFQQWKGAIKIIITFVGILGISNIVAIVQAFS